MAATAQAFVLTARAKFNVRLEIGAVRADGLHDVRSVVGDLVVGDEVAFAPSETGFSVTCDDPGIPQADNLAWRAAQALDFNLPSVLIHVRKMLPQQAGLGGGSADAAAALRGLASIMAEMGITLPGAALREAASRVGSDVAACLTPGLKLVEGSGQIVRPLPAAVLPWGVLLLKPAAGMPTADAYHLLDEARRSGAVTAPHQGDAAADLCDALARGDFARTCALAHNDFQEAIEAALPDVADARARLRSAGAAATILCGSGSCVAGLFEDVAAAGRALTLLRPKSGEWTAATGFAHADTGFARNG
jgi:4-diphosphocytidyl-2-C-methyl-D-erythritol kinase